MNTNSTPTVQMNTRRPWNKDRLIGPKPPSKLKDIWAIRFHLQLAEHTRDLALFNLAIDSKLPGCDFVKLPVRDVAQDGRAASRASVMQQKTSHPVKFELTAQTRGAADTWIAEAHLDATRHLFPSRLTHSPHISTRQYARIVKSWIRQHRAGSQSVWRAFDAPDEGDANLQADEASPRCSVVTRTHQIGKHGPLPWH